MPQRRCANKKAAPKSRRPRPAKVIRQARVTERQLRRFIRKNWALIVIAIVLRLATPALGSKLLNRWFD